MNEEKVNPIQLPHEKKGEQAVQEFLLSSVGFSLLFSDSWLQHASDVIFSVFSAIAATGVQQGTRDKLSTIDNITSANTFITTTNLEKKSDMPIPPI